MFSSAYWLVAQPFRRDATARGFDLGLEDPVKQGSR